MRMRKESYSRKVIVAVVLIAVLFMLCFPAFSCSKPLDQDDQLINLVNLYRYQNGQSILFEKEELSNYARYYAKEMADNDFIGHVSKISGDLRKRTNDNYPHEWTVVGENLGRSYNEPLLLMQAFKDSPSHNANMLFAPYNCVGVGCYEYQGLKYWAVEFARYEKISY